PEMMPKVLDLPKHIVEGSLEGMRRPGAKPPERIMEPSRSPRPSSTGSTTGDGGTENKSILGLMKDRVDSDMAKLDAGLINPDGTPTPAATDAGIGADAGATASRDAGAH